MRLKRRRKLGNEGRVNFYGETMGKICGGMTYSKNNTSSAEARSYSSGGHTCMKENRAFFVEKSDFAN